MIKIKTIFVQIVCNAPVLRLCVVLCAVLCAVLCVVLCVCVCADCVQIVCKLCADCVFAYVPEYPDIVVLYCYAGAYICVQVYVRMCVSCYLCSVCVCVCGVRLRSPELNPIPPYMVTYAGIW